MIQITEEKKEKLTEMCEKMLKYGGKMMQCLESLEDEDFDARGYDPDDDDFGMRGRMGMRRGVRGTGRYSRY